MFQEPVIFWMPYEYAVIIIMLEMYLELQSLLVLLYL